MLQTLITSDLSGGFHKNGAVLWLGLVIPRSIFNVVKFVWLRSLLIQNVCKNQSFLEIEISQSVVHLNLYIQDNMVAMEGDDE